MTCDVRACQIEKRAKKKTNKLRSLYFSDQVALRGCDVNLYFNTRNDIVEMKLLKSTHEITYILTMMGSHLYL